MGVWADWWAGEQANQGPVPQGGSFINPLASGATFSFGDEIVGGLGGLASMIGGNTYMHGYEKVRDAIRDDADQFRARNPKTSMGLEILGAVPTAALPWGTVARTAGLGAKAAQGARIGAIEGGIYGAGEGRGSYEDKARTAIEGAGLGMLGGAAVPVAITGGVAGGRAIKQAAQDAGGAGGLLGDFAGDVSGSIPPMQKPPKIRAYQGSPHDFAAERLVRHADGRQEYIVGAPDVPPDIPEGAELVKDFPLGRMRRDKMGTGEGAQVYGAGHYLAENELVGRTYRDLLSPPRNDAPEKLRFSTLEKRLGKETEDVEYQIKHLLDGDGYWNDFVEAVNREGSQTLKSGIERDAPGSLNWGKMYEANINAAPDELIDWDKPLSEQPAKVQQFFGFEPRDKPKFNVVKTGSDNPSWRYHVDGFPAAPTREEALEAANEIFSASMASKGETPGTILTRAHHNPRFAGDLLKKDTATDTELSDALSQSGIKGIRFLDQGSRNKKSVFINGNLSSNKIDDIAAHYIDIWGADRVGRIEIELRSDKSLTKAQKADVLDRIKQWDKSGAKIERRPHGTSNYVIFDDETIEIIRKYGLAGLMGGGAAAATLAGSDSAEAGIMGLDRQ